MKSNYLLRKFRITITCLLTGSILLSGCGGTTGTEDVNSSQKESSVTVQESEPTSESTPDTVESESSSDATPDTAASESSSDTTPDATENESSSDTTPDTAVSESSSDTTPDAAEGDSSSENSSDIQNNEPTSESTSTEEIPQTSGDTQTVVPTDADVIISSGQTITPIAMNETASVDLDGDGTNEIVSVNYELTQDMYKENPIIQINNYVFEGDNSLYMECPDVATWYIFDVDTTDSYKEIGIYQDGPSSDPYTTLLRFEDGVLHNLGGFSDKPIDDWNIYVPNYPGDYEEFLGLIDRSRIRIEVPGDGTILANQRIEILETNFAQGLWKLENAESFTDSKLVLQVREVYDIMGYGMDRGEFTLTIKDSLQVYPERDFACTDFVELTTGDTIDFCQYYPEGNWVKVSWNQEEGFGWLHIKEPFFIYQIDENGEGTYIYDSDLIEHLAFYD